MQVRARRQRHFSQETHLNPTQTEDARKMLRGHSFFEPGDLTIYRSAKGVGDDGRTALPLSETLIMSLLINVSEAQSRTVFGHARPLLCVCNSRQPVCTTVWPNAEGRMTVYITDGRQRGGESAQRGDENPGAIEAINRRVKMICEVAEELARAEPELLADTHKFRIRVRNRCKELHATDSRWSWASPWSIPLYIGGKIGDANSTLESAGLVNWATCGSLEKRATPIPYVVFVAHEPEDRDPATCASQLTSLGLKAAQVATPPTVEARQFASLCDPLPPPRVEGESEEDYQARLRAGGPYGQGLPVVAVAALVGVTINTVQDRRQILHLEPEIQAAIDAHVRGEPGLTLRQVRDGGFYVAGTGGRSGARKPVTRERQLELLDLLVGRRGLTAATAGGDDAASDSPSDSDGTVSARRELSTEDSAADRHRADEPRSRPGPDSPATAGETAKPGKLDPSLFLALRDRVEGLIEEIPIDATGAVQTDEGRALYVQLDAVYHLCAMIAGDPTAFVCDSANPRVNTFRQKCGDAVADVLRSRGLLVRHGVGPVAAVPVLPTSSRKPSEMEVTPRDAAPVSPFGAAPSDVQDEPAAAAPTATALAAAPAASTAPTPAKAKREPATKKPTKAGKRGPQTAKKPAKPAKPGKKA